MTPEGRVKKQIRAYLDTLKMDCWYTHVPAGMLGTRGVPDLLICYRGHFIAVEVKSKRGKVAPLQAWTLDKISMAGGIAVAVRSVEDVKKHIEWLTPKGRGL